MMVKMCIPQVVNFILKSKHIRTECQAEKPADSLNLFIRILNEILIANLEIALWIILSELTTHRNAVTPSMGCLIHIGIDSRFNI